MEEEKRKSKRRRPKKKKSKSLFVGAVGFESKNIKSKNGKVCLAVPYKKGNVIDIKKDDEGSVNQNIKDLNPKRNINKKRRKRYSNLAVKSSDFNDNGTLCFDKHITGINHSKTSSMDKTTSDAKLKKNSVAIKQTLSNKMSNTQKLSLKEKLQNKLESGRFRWINEKLYTTNSLSAFKMFKSEPELFDVYHQGFSSQVQKWPVNPVDTMIDWIMERSPQLIIADMGCGEAKISQTVANKVFSFDLVAVNNFVTACDMAKVPLADESVDIVIYCLSLMGTNLNDFLQEAHRILKSNGILKIAEVVSRFECLGSFEETVSCFGFKLLIKDTTNKMFVQFEFKKLFKKPDQMKTLPLSLKPCLYKRR